MDQNPYSSVNSVSRDYFTLLHEPYYVSVICFVLGRIVFNVPYYVQCLFFCLDWD